ncbi:short-chain dehydrogenase [Youhaiella tibetensis]|uniref:Glucose 1-dehydrogenase n=1 Tax=Paradevosia tibetensis TaxID=1447062 RepID=A0A5B9DNZ9_9HYPH|nr:glucose 1-dehydrogenase [Youhaiella tibetensis]QEE20615.1 glucose 1-dehydrogenase [Youhaiella tibetensis]GGF22609.1 short-chain dehydrogenase [Youhaiella tibetensis]
MNRMQGKVAVVTGAAFGIGAAVARKLAQEGASVVLTDLKDDAGSAIAAEIGQAAAFFHHDVTQEAQWEDIMSKALERFGHVDVVVNNAGVGFGGPPEEQTLDDWHKLMRVNLDAVFLGTKHAIRTMKKVKPAGDSGSIVNMSSIEGLVGDPNLGAYNASKGGVRIYSKSVALYCAKNRLGIRVNSVHPGYILTPMVENSINSSPNPDAARKHLVDLHPIGHLGEPDDIAWGVLYLASDEAKFVTGTELVIDGGYTAQ